MNRTIFATAVLLFASLGIAASGQRPAYDPTSPTGVRLPPKTIIVDQACRILQNPAAVVMTNVKPRWHKDEIMCHVEGVHNSDHVEERISAGLEQKNWVFVTEQTYVLQNISDAPVVFEVQEYVPEGWQVDSDPQPVDTVPIAGKKGDAAIFRVNAEPGEIVRLHTGRRHTEMGKAKPVKIAQ
jgi:hypothetical protein